MYHRASHSIARQVALASLLMCSGPVLSKSVDEVQRWIANNTVTVRSIDPADEDFTDLEPLVDAIGSSRVVQLGEPSHGAGNSFSAKVRLIQFLHQRMGFDVLVWPSGMHGLRFVDAGLRAGEDAVSAAQRGIFTIWSDAEQVKPLLEYVKATQSSTRPLEMAGFDMLFTANKAFERFAAELRSFVSVVHDPAVRSRSQQLSERALESYERCCSKTPPNKPALDDLLVAAQTLLTTIDANRELFARAHGAKETSFMEHAIANLRADAAGKLDLLPGPGTETHAQFRNRVSYSNRRDQQNARNLLWLVENGYPGRKIIVWGHNAHLMNAYFAPQNTAIHLEPQPGDMKPTGTYLRDWLGSKVYTIALTTYEGTDGWATSQTVTPIPPTEAGSLEARLHALGKPYLFVDFRKLGTSPEHPLRKPQPMRILIPVAGRDTAAPAHGNYTIDDVTQVFDAVFFIDRTTPATRVLNRGVSK